MVAPLHRPRSRISISKRSIRLQLPKGKRLARQAPDPPQIQVRQQPTTLLARVQQARKFAERVRGHLGLEHDDGPAGTSSVDLLARRVDGVSAGGLFFDFGPVRAAGRRDGVDAVFMITRGVHASRESGSRRWRRHETTPPRRRSTRLAGARLCVIGGPVLPCIFSSA